MTTNRIKQFDTYRYPRKMSEVFLCNAREAYAMERYRVGCITRVLQSPMLMLCLAVAAMILAGVMR